MLRVSALFRASLPGEDSEPDGDQEETGGFIGLLRGGIHFGWQGGGTEKSCKVEIAHGILQAEKAGPDGKADAGGEGGKGQWPACMEDSGDGGSSVKKEPEPAVVIAILGGVVDLQNAEQGKESGENVAGDFHGISGVASALHMRGLLESVFLADLR